MERAIPQKKRGVKHKRTRTDFDILADIKVPPKLDKRISEAPDHQAAILTLAPKLSKQKTVNGPSATSI